MRPYFCFNLKRFEKVAVASACSFAMKPLNWLHLRNGVFKWANQSIYLNLHFAFKLILKVVPLPGSDHLMKIFPL